MSNQKYLNFEILFNIILLLLFVFSRNYLEADLILGAFSTTFAISILFYLREENKVALRELRFKIKEAYLTQYEVVKRYYFFYILLVKTMLKYLKKITSKFLQFKFKKALLHGSFKLKFFCSKIIFLKLFFLNILLKMVFSISTKTLVLL